MGGTSSSAGQVQAALDSDAATRSGPVVLPHASSAAVEDAKASTCAACSSASAGNDNRGDGDAQGPVPATNSLPAKLRPPSRAQIGRAAWRYVHTMAVDYPEQPRPQEQVEALDWLRSFLRLYPCGLCAEEFVAVCHDLPPRLESRCEYVMWWCEAHNRVRDDLSQQRLECDFARLFAAGQAGRVLTE
eukprot:TRINITY_DN68439_c0_g1_i1.p2 TRINITY_DN68439_c0_g1~~TRINITY_DN68439_c0_g1_i1.p2  ORF type:complete len:188 (-),score=37.00 TRINITY_DN68439_c0_g1_i1:54-617(-)